MQLGEGNHMDSVADLQRYALRNMNMAGKDAKSLADIEGLTSRTITISGFEALEIVYIPEALSLSGPTVTTRGLTVLGGDFLLVVVMINLDGGDGSTPLQWSTIVSSLRVERGMSLGMRIVWGAGIALILLVVILFLRRTSAAGRRNAFVGLQDPLSAPLSSEGWGPNGIPEPLRSEAPTPGAVGTRTSRTLPSSAPRPLPGVGGNAGSGTRPIPPGAARTLPVSPPREPARAGASPAAASKPNPPGMGRTLPASPPRQPAAAGPGSGAAPRSFGMGRTLPSSPPRQPAGARPGSSAAAKPPGMGRTLPASPPRSLPGAAPQVPGTGLPPAPGIGRTLPSASPR